VWVLRITARRGQHIAVVALARRVAGILYALLRDGTTFDSQRSPRPVVAATLAASAIGRARVTVPASRRFDGWVSASVALAALEGRRIDGAPTLRILSCAGELSHGRP